MKKLLTGFYLPKQVAKYPYFKCPSKSSEGNQKQRYWTIYAEGAPLMVSMTTLQFLFHYMLRSEVIPA